jgi:HEAT repeat protein
MPTEMDDLQRLLRQLGSEPDAIPFSRLYKLSDLVGEQLAEFRAVWETLPPVRRRRLIYALVELAEASFQVNFDAIFRYCLDDPDDQVRAAAIDGLWENEEVSLVSSLLTMLRADPSAQVRAAAATGLGRYVLAGQLEQLAETTQARIIAALLAVIHLPDESLQVRRRAVESVAYACTPEVIDVLELAYYDEDESMRISAVTGMGRSCDEQWTDIVLKELESPSPAMRYEAAWACGELGLRQAVPFLADLMNDRDRQVRNATIWALGQIGGELAKQLLLAAYADADEDTEAALDEALAEHALLEEKLDFLLYEFDGGLDDDLDDDDLDDDLFDDDLASSWTDDDEDAGDRGDLEI